MITLEYKPIGISCVDLLNELKNKYPENDKIGFAGRLDEMAHGELIVLHGDCTKMTKKYQSLDKTYKFRFVVGVETDTTSVLGVIKNRFDPNIVVDTNIITDAIESFNNKTIDQEYHIFSSFIPKGVEIKKPLWWWCLNNRIDEINPKPSKKVTIYKSKIIEIKTIPVQDFITESLENLDKLKSCEFRKDLIIDQWKNYKYSNDTSFTEFTCEINVSSGFYVRQFVKDIGSIIGANLLVVEIERLKHSFVE